MNLYWRRAIQAKESAKRLLATGDPEGAVNRAYYSMFNAARALLAARTELQVNDVRRHSAVLKLFSEHAVKAGLIDRRLNVGINKAFDLRAAADYGDTEVGADEAEEIVRLLDDFLLAVEPYGSDPK